jgi:5-methylcytosine-specific restriction protein B
LTTVIRFRGEEHRLTREDVLAAAQRSTPERLTTYYVEIDGRRFPPKQLVRVATGTRQQFNSANARSLLTKLGFTVQAV